MAKVRLTVLRFTFAVNSLLLLRLLFGTEELVKEEDSCDVSWSSIDLLRPPRALRPILESVRLNELIAHSQYRCAQQLALPENSHLPVHLCARPDPLGLPVNGSGKGATAAFVLGGTSSNLLFPKAFAERFSSAKLTLVAPDKAWLRQLWPESGQGSTVLQAAKVDEIVEIMNNIGSMDVLHMQSHQSSTKLLSALIEERALDQVGQLTFSFSVTDATAHQWYTLLHDLFFRANHAIFAASQEGSCGRVLASCAYLVSTVRVGAEASVLPPSFGMATPDEEFRRLATFLTNPKYHSPRPHCQLINAGCASWTVCGGSTEARPCVLYLFRLPPSSASSLKENLRCGVAFAHCSLQLYDPTLPASLDAPGLRLHNFTLSDKPHEYLSTGHRSDAPWTLKPLDSVVRELAHDGQPLPALLLDLQGWDVEVLEELIRSRVLERRFRSVVLRWTFWYGEEFEVEQAKFGQFWRLRRQGLRVAQSRVLRHRGAPDHTSTVEISLVNDHLIERTH